MCHRNTVQGNMNGYKSDTNAGIIGTLGTIDTIMTLVTFMTFTGERLDVGKNESEQPSLLRMLCKILAAGRSPSQIRSEAIILLWCDAVIFFQSSLGNCENVTTPIFSAQVGTWEGL